MAFTGKATYSAGTTLPELAEDVSDLVGIVSPYETPLLEACNILFFDFDNNCFCLYPPLSV